MTNLLQRKINAAEELKDYLIKKLNEDYNTDLTEEMNNQIMELAEAWTPFYNNEGYSIFNEDTTEIEEMYTNSVYEWGSIGEDKLLLDLINQGIFFSIYSHLYSDSGVLSEVLEMQEELLKEREELDTEEE